MLPRRRIPARPKEPENASNVVHEREDSLEGVYRRARPRVEVENEALRQEVIELRRELQEMRQARQPPPVPSPVPEPAPAIPVPPPPVRVDEPVVRQEDRRGIDEGGVSMFDFLKLGLPEFKGEIGEEPQDFIKQVDKVIRRLPCSDARAI